MATCGSTCRRIDPALNAFLAKRLRPASFVSRISKSVSLSSGYKVRDVEAVEDEAATKELREVSVSDPSEPLRFCLSARKPADMC